MISQSLSHIAENISGQLIGTDQVVDAVITDSRIIDQLDESKRYLFVALKGPHYDAHQFIHSIAEKVVAVIVNHACDLTIPQIVVNNTRQSLAELARLNRDNSSAKVVAITGSSGKTTVKEMVASILLNLGTTHATGGNFNNDIGVPLTLLGINKQDKFAVIELGANHEGEIAYTADITRPDVALVNNVSEAHLQGFGDLKGVARAKSEIYLSLAKNGTAIVNIDDQFSAYFLQNINCAVLRFSTKLPSDVYASNIIINTDQSTHFDLNFNGQTQTIQLGVVGIHNVANATAAAACCIAMGVSLADISEGLKQVAAVPGRLIVKQLANGCRVIDDTYNANVSSMMAAIDLLGQYKSPRILVIGDMGELGNKAKQYHEQIGAHAKTVGIELLYSCGELSEFAHLAFINGTLSSSKDSIKLDTRKGFHFSDQSELIKTLIKEAKDGATILVKGSRSAHMENVVIALERTFESSEFIAEGELNHLHNIASLKGDQ